MLNLIVSHYSREKEEMPYTPDELENKLKALLEASYVVILQFYPYYRSIPRYFF